MGDVVRAHFGSGVGEGHLVPRVRVVGGWMRWGGGGASAACLGAGRTAPRALVCRTGLVSEWAESVVHPEGHLDGCTCLRSSERVLLPSLRPTLSIGVRALPRCRFQCGSEGMAHAQSRLCANTGAGPPGGQPGEERDRTGVLCKLSAA